MLLIPTVYPPRPLVSSVFHASIWYSYEYMKKHLKTWQKVIIGILVIIIGYFIIGSIDIPKKSVSKTPFNTPIPMEKYSSITSTKDIPLVNANKRSKSGEKISTEEKRYLLQYETQLTIEMLSKSRKEIIADTVSVSGYEHEKFAMMLPRIPFFFHPNRTLKNYTEAVKFVSENINDCSKMNFYEPGLLNWVLPNGQEAPLMTNLSDVGNILCQL